MQFRPESQASTVSVYTRFEKTDIGPVYKIVKKIDTDPVYMCVKKIDVYLVYMSIKKVVLVGFYTQSLPEKMGHFGSVLPLCGQHILTPTNRAIHI